MENRLSSIPSGLKSRLFLILLTVTVVVVSLRTALTVPLISEKTPLGIVSLSLAGDPIDVQRILNSWDTHDQILAAFGLGLDFLGLALYSTTIGLACFWISSEFNCDHWLRRIGFPFAWAQLFAGVLNAIENCTLLTMLLDWRVQNAEYVALSCAVMKLVLVVSGLSYCFAGIFHLQRDQE